MKDVESLIDNIRMLACSDEKVYRDAAYEIYLLRKKWIDNRSNRDNFEWKKFIADFQVCRLRHFVDLNDKYLFNICGSGTFLKTGKSMRRGKTLGKPIVGRDEYFRGWIFSLNTKNSDKLNSDKLNSDKGKRTHCM